MYYIGSIPYDEDYLEHHGIKGQKWGVKNGPPYPLKGGDYSESEKKHVYKERKIRKRSQYNRKHIDKTITTNDVLTTLSYNKDRTKDVDMFYATYEKGDKHEYNWYFNQKAPQPIYDEDGNEIGTGNFYKYRIDNAVVKDIKVASQDSGQKIFNEVYKKDRDFYNFIRDPKRMLALFPSDQWVNEHPAYKEAKKALDNLSQNGGTPSEKDMRMFYRLFNYIIPSDGHGDAKAGKDMATQRAKFFKEAKKQGYGAILDTNDALYSGLRGNAPVIVFDMSNIMFKDAERTSMAQVAKSRLVVMGRRLIGRGWT